ncbi:MAG: hypothetical protein IJU44_08595 [Kiritimatiellae bacterium]|nr:hypothetical protein [Kiritimatiellia bacterium]
MVNRPPHRRQSGQAVLFILLGLVALVFFMIFIADLHRIIQRKDQAQNAGDAAALAAARWQGSTLNLVGEMNLMHILALAVPDDQAIGAITGMQARLCFTGPLAGLLAAQVAAKNNHIYVNEGMTSLLTEHVADIRNNYSVDFGNGMVFPEPWPGAWTEYADMITQIAEDGIAAGPDNMRTFDLDSDHILLDKAFYDAVNGYGWCWFFRHAYGLLRNYNSFHDWPPLPENESQNYANSEIFGLGLQPYTLPLKQIFTPDEAAALVNNYGFPNGQISPGALATNGVSDRIETWYYYRTDEWGAWSRIKSEGDDDFPITGPVRKQYDVAGADAVVRVGATVQRMSTNAGRTDSVVWSAAAKPFGYFDTDLGQESVTASSYLVLPAFRNVRLIPVDAATGSENSSADADWVRHIRGHLKNYLEHGTCVSGCKYCQTLAFWDKNPSITVAETTTDAQGNRKQTTVSKPFRQIGIDWLNEFSASCRQSSGGSGHGGGTRRGH